MKKAEGLHRGTHLKDAYVETATINETPPQLKSAQWKDRVSSTLLVSDARPFNDEFLQRRQKSRIKGYCLHIEAGTTQIPPSVLQVALSTQSQALEIRKRLVGECLLVRKAVWSQKAVNHGLGRDGMTRFAKKAIGGFVLIEMPRLLTGDVVIEAFAKVKRLQGLRQARH